MSDMPCAAHAHCKVAISRSLPAGLASYRRSHAVRKFVVRAQSDDRGLQTSELSRREFVLRSVNLTVLADAALNQSDPRTVVNSLLGTVLTQAQKPDKICKYPPGHVRTDHQVRMACRN